MPSSHCTPTRPARHQLTRQATCLSPMLCAHTVSATRKHSAMAMHQRQRQAGPHPWSRHAPPCPAQVSHQPNSRSRHPHDEPPVTRATACAHLPNDPCHRRTAPPTRPARHQPTRQATCLPPMHCAHTVSATRKHSAMAMHQRQHQAGPHPWSRHASPCPAQVSPQPYTQRPADPFPKHGLHGLSFPHMHQAHHPPAYEAPYALDIPRPGHAAPMHALTASTYYMLARHLPMPLSLAHQ